MLRAQLGHHARIQIHQGKTQVWNRGGVDPANIQFSSRMLLSLTQTRLFGEEDEVLPTIDQGVVILGTPLGHSDFVQRHLQSKVESHRVLLERIPAVPDVQAAWLILLFCASARANFLLRALPPEATREFARQHDESLRTCLSELLGVTVDAWDIASLPLADIAVHLTRGKFHFSSLPVTWGSIDSFTICNQEEFAFSAALRGSIISLCMQTSSSAGSLWTPTQAGSKRQPQNG